MTDVTELRERLGRIFESAFRVEDIAESLASFDAERPAGDAREILERRLYRVAGVRERGTVTGYVRTSDLTDGCVGDHCREFEKDEVVSGDASLSRAIGQLAGRDRIFVTVLGKVGGIVTWTDLQKPSVRMWLFGMVTLIEMAFTRIIEALFPDDGWVRLISAGRVEKARSLLAERERLQDAGGVRLLDCLQFSDKGQVLMRDEDARRILAIPSRSEGDRIVRQVSSLRDSLAHSQDFITDGWEVIVRLAGSLDEILRISSAFPDLRRAPAPRRRR